MDRRTFIKFGLGGALSAGLIGSYSVFVERTQYKLNHYLLNLSNLPHEFNGYKILHLTDIHVGPYLSFNDFKKIISSARQVKCDLIALTGDYTHRMTNLEDVKKVWNELNTLEAPDGVLNVLGNHDHWDAGQYAIDLLENSGQSLRLKTCELVRGNQNIIFGGAGDFWEEHSSVDNIFKNTTENDFKIMLSHNPDTIDTVLDVKIDLTISGHTHGGQVVFPFLGATVLPVKNSNYDFGIKETNVGKLFISKGVGTSIIPVRFRCTPEFALLELRRKT